MRTRGTTCLFVGTRDDAVRHWLRLRSHDIEAQLEEAFIDSLSISVSCGAGTGIAKVLVPESAKDDALEVLGSATPNRLGDPTD